MTRAGDSGRYGKKLLWGTAGQGLGEIGEGQGGVGGGELREAVDAENAEHEVRAQPVHHIAYFEAVGEGADEFVVVASDHVTAGR